MINKLIRKIKYIKLLFEDNNQGCNKDNDSFKVSKSIEENLEFINNKIGHNSDFICRRIKIGLDKQIDVAIVYIEGLVNKATVNEDILKPLMKDTKDIYSLEKADLNTFDFIYTNILTSGEVKCTDNLDNIIDSVLTGETAVLINKSNRTLIIGTKGWESRGVQPPKTEVVVRGPRESFTETIRTNTALLRRKIHNPNLVIESMKLGKLTKTDICIAYIKGIVNDKLIEEIKRRLNDIKTDSILESGYIEEFIEDAPFSPFSTIANTERPDVAVAKILEGRAAIFVDGTPFVLTVPMLFVESLQVSEDYYSRPYYTTIIRWLRIISLLLTILLPAVYVALTTYHQEIIPTPLLITMIAAHEGTPFPAFIAALFIGIVYEILREAGVRLPRPVGQAVSIVGALVIGESAVSAGLISAPMVIMVALTAISSFVVSAQADVASILRIFLLFLAGTLGAFGITMGLLIILIHLTTLRSFGVPYFSPLAPLSPRDLKDVIIRSPLWAVFTRPRLIGWKEPQRQEFKLMPHPPQKKNNSTDSIDEDNDN